MKALNALDGLTGFGGEQVKPSWLAALNPAALGGEDFVNNRAYGMGHDFARALAAYQKNASNVWVSFGSGVLRRIDGIGAFIERSATNLCTNNTGNSAGSGLGLVGTTLAAWGAGNSPAQDNNAKRATQGSGATDSYQQTGIPITAAATYSISCSFKYDSSTTWVRLSFSDNVANVFQVWVDISTMSLGTASVIGTATVSSPSIATETDGWARVTVSGTMPNTVAGGMAVISAVTGNGSTTRAAGTYGLWCIQLESATATSPILTSGSAVTRPADDLDLRDFAGTRLRFTFDNDTTQDFAGISAPYQVPTNLNRATIKNVISLAA